MICGDIDLYDVRVMYNYEDKVRRHKVFNRGSKLKIVDLVS